MPLTIDIPACIEAVRTDGFCILRDQLPRAAVEAVRDAFAPLLEAHVREHDDHPNRGPRRHYIPLPFRPPFYHPAFFNNDAIIAIISGVFGEDMAIDQFASDTPLKGSVHQDVHADIGPLFPESPDLVCPPPLLATNFSFIDVTPAHGPFEVARGTHRMPRAQALEDVKQGRIGLEPLFLNVGDVLIRDVRTVHRGTPNTTDQPRGVAVISYVRAWYRREGHQSENRMPAATWAMLSEREQHLLRLIPRDGS